MSEIIKVEFLGGKVVHIDEIKSLVITKSFFDGEEYYVLSCNKHEGNKIIDSNELKRAKRLSTINKVAKEYGLEFVQKKGYIMPSDTKYQVVSYYSFSFTHYNDVISYAKEINNKEILVSSKQYVEDNIDTMSKRQIIDCLSQKEWKFELKDLKVISDNEFNEHKQVMKQLQKPNWS